MRILYMSGALLVLCVLSAVGHKLQEHQHGDIQLKKISFPVKHDEHKSPEHGDHGHKHHHSQHIIEHHEDHVAQYENHGHDKYQGCHGHHDNNEHGHHDHDKYEFKYGVNDPKTGDFKQQWEARDGDKVKGVYSLKKADCTKRIEEYTAEKKNGYEATVHKIGHAHHDLGHHHDGAAGIEHQVHIKHDHQKDHTTNGHHHNNGHASSFIIVKKQSKD